MRRVLCAIGLALLGAGVLSACSKSPTQPPPPPPVVNPPVNTDPPANTPPAIDAIAVQGRRPKQPARFADIRETVDVTATVRDPETSVDELVYQWSATAGTFDGTGRTVTWTAPDAVEKTPTTVTITLKVVENYGHPGQAKVFSQDTTATTTLALHDSAKEIGDLAVRFLTEFSKPELNQDWSDIMRDFKSAACPDPGEFELERQEVIDHYTYFTMHAYDVGAPSVTTNFGGLCTMYRPKQGDACVRVPVYWNSTDRRKTPAVPESTRGVDHLTAAYSPTDARWWLCSSYYEPTGTLRSTFYSRR